VTTQETSSRGPWASDPQRPYRAELNLSCGWVIVDPDGHESTLGYLHRIDAENEADRQCKAYFRGRANADWCVARITRLEAGLDAILSRASAASADWPGASEAEKIALDAIHGDRTESP